VSGFPLIPAGVYDDAVRVVCAAGGFEPRVARVMVDALVARPGVLSALALAVCRADPLGLTAAVVSDDPRPATRGPFAVAPASADSGGPTSPPRPDRGPSDRTPAAEPAGPVSTGPTGPPEQER
jgi:hypothetical protein